MNIDLNSRLRKIRVRETGFQPCSSKRQISYTLKAQTGNAFREVETAELKGKSKARRPKSKYCAYHWQYASRVDMFASFSRSFTLLCAKFELQ